MIHENDCEIFGHWVSKKEIRKAVNIGARRQQNTRLPQLCRLRSGSEF
jgi:hypothetical protein